MYHRKKFGGYRFGVLGMIATKVKSALVADESGNCQYKFNTKTDDCFEIKKDSAKSSSAFYTVFRLSFPKLPDAARRSPTGEPAAKP